MNGFLRPGVTGATAESFPLFRCPLCDLTGEIDEDQFEGRVSIDCPDYACNYHETKNWKAEETGVMT